MRKISVKELVDFRRGTDRQKSTFAKKIDSIKPKTNDDSAGGDYWIRSLSALREAYRENDKSYLNNKIDRISADWKSDTIDRTKSMYKRNIEVLRSFLDFDFGELRPSFSITLLGRVKKRDVLTYKGLPIEIPVHEIYSFRNADNNSCIGAVLFVAKLNGYTLNELGIFAQAVYNFMNKNFSDKYQISSSDIKIVDAITTKVVSHQMLISEELPPLYASTLEEIVKLRNSLEQSMGRSQF